DTARATPTRTPPRTTRPGAPAPRAGRDRSRPRWPRPSPDALPRRDARGARPWGRLRSGRRWPSCRGVHQQRDRLGDARRLLAALDLDGVLDRHLLALLDVAHLQDLRAQPDP